MTEMVGNEIVKETQSLHDIEITSLYLKSGFKYIYELECILLQIELLDILTKHGTHRIIMNRTIFHPQGGGQPSDKGLIFSGDSIFEVRAFRIDKNWEYFRLFS